MRYSKLLGKTLKETPSGADTISHQLLVRGGFVDQLMAGVFSFLPLGWRVHQKIEKIIREEMNAIGGQEVFLPSLQKKSQWLSTGRWETIDPPLFKFKDRHDHELALGPTHEEIITDLARRFVHSYRDLPLAVYQIQNKFRNEMRTSGGLLRVREFVMKDLYSFHANEEDLVEYFKRVFEAYQKIYRRCDLPVIASKAGGGTIGGTETYEFQVPAAVGEDRILWCEGCGYAVNVETRLIASLPEDSCPECGKKNLRQISAIEVGHIFNLGAEYSQKMGAAFTEADGRQKPLLMGCYGIGLGRLLATIVETHHDARGIVWPESVAPFKVQLINLEDQTSRSEKAYEGLVEAGVEVLFDDREDVSAGEKFADADLIGCPDRVVLSAKTLAKDSAEVKQRHAESLRLVPLDELATFFLK